MACVKEEKKGMLKHWYDSFVFAVDAGHHVVQTCCSMVIYIFNSISVLFLLIFNDF